MPLIQQMIDFLNNLGALSDRDFIFLFTKSFAVVFSLFFVIYSIVLVRQTTTLNETLTTRRTGFFIMISQVQLLLSIFVLLLALFLI
jgi:hypothetical protein